MRRHDYLPFGEENQAGGAIRSAANGYQQEGVRQKHTGYERDGETGLDFAQARYYSNLQGRFTSIDPLSSLAIRNPQSWNRYSYVLNSPLAYTDRDGLTPTCIIDGQQRSCSEIFPLIRTDSIQRITYFDGGRVVFDINRDNFYREGESSNGISIKYFDAAAWEIALNSYLFYFGQKGLSQETISKWPGFSGSGGTGGAGATDNDWGPEARTLSYWLRNNPALLQEVRDAYARNPEWWGIDADNDLVFYRDWEASAFIRNRDGRGHHPFGLALGGPSEQVLVPLSKANRGQHQHITNLQRDVINEIKRQLGIPIKRTK
jgi:RHS repeat-associated protein